MGTPELLLPAYESLARLIRAIVRQELEPIAQAIAEIPLRGPRDEMAEPDHEQ